MNKLIVSFLIGIIFFSFNLQAQRTNYELAEKQNDITDTLSLRLMQNFNTDSLIRYFDTSFLSVKQLTDTINKIKIDFKQFLGLGKYSYSIVSVFDKKEHIMRCRFSDNETNETKYFMDLIYKNTEGSKIIRIEIKNSEVLAKENKARRDFMNSGEIPPPPPPPPSIGN